jgi:hypothetical protein
VSPTALHTPLFCQPTVGDAAINYSGQEFRQYVRAALTSGSAVGGEQGIFASSGFLVTQHGAGANLTVDVASGLAAVVGDDVSSQGTYQVWNDGIMTVSGWTVPGSGTFHHRLVLQVQDKLNNGAFTGYTANLVPVLDTGGGLPAEPNSAITLATIDIASGAASIVNANINDYRTQIGRVQAVKTSDQSRTSTSLTDDASLQLLNLQPNAWLALDAILMYSAGTGGSDGFNLTWRTSGVTLLKYNRMDGAGTAGSINTKDRADTISANGTGTSVLMPLNLHGYIQTGAAPCLAVVQWGGNSANSTTLRAGSRVAAVRYV